METSGICLLNLQREHKTKSGINGSAIGKFIQVFFYTNI
jgi:hypothetical protein